MVNHLTGFLNKCVLSFKRDNYLEPSPSVKQKTPRPLALVFSVSRMTSFSVIISYRYCMVYPKGPLITITNLQQVVYDRTVCRNLRCKWEQPVWDLAPV